MEIITYDQNEFNEIIKKIAKTATKVFSLPKKSYIELSFVSKEEIKEINNETRKVDSVTDVLSFPNLSDVFGKKIELKDYPFDIDMETKMLNIGSIVVCVDKIKEQSVEYQTGEKREFSYLLTHGVLHLLGYDHIDENDKKIMREKEEEILRIANV